MKKLISFLSALLIGLCLISCGKKTAADADGFYNDIDDAVVVAQKNNQDILVILTMEGDDQYSSSFMNIARSQHFKDEITSNYTVVHMDFSEKSYMATVAPETASKAYQEAAEEKALQMQKNTQFANLLNAQVSPSFYLLTKDEYFIGELEYTDEISSFDGFKELLESKKERADELHKLVEQIKVGSTMDKIAAIDSMYESTNIQYRTFLADLIEKVISLDSKNESGLLSKYLLADAESEAISLFAEGNVVKAAQVYIRLSDNSKLLPEHKQRACYMAAYILGYGGSTDYPLILSYLKKAIEAYPNGENVEMIQNLYDYIAQNFEAATDSVQGNLSK